MSTSYFAHLYSRTALIVKKLNSTPPMLFPLSFGHFFHEGLKCVRKERVVRVDEGLNVVERNDRTVKGTHAGERDD